MLFISHVYFCLFLPVALLVYHLLITRNRPTESVAWLVAASLFFYGWWNPVYLVLIVGSIVCNYGLGTWMSRSEPGTWKGLLLLALAGNLGMLGYFKYANFLVDATNQLAGTGFQLERIVLPLAISFFTLQQVAYVIDAYRGDARPYPFLRYSLFVCFFPQLIAGPIVHHRVLIPQLDPQKLAGIDANRLALGISIFVAGMFKKLAVADQLTPWVSQVFDATDPDAITALAAWIATYAWSLQLYFDFSGYSDMAIGAAMMFGIRLPINFDSPFKAATIRDIWRRWHITLSDFIRGYVYGPLGAGKSGHARMYRNLFIAFMVTGVWHGAGWNFVVFGALNGGAVLLHQAWKDLGLRMPHWLGVLFTFNFWVMAMVTFRAPTLEQAVLVYQSMLRGVEFAAGTHDQYLVIGVLLTLMAVVWFTPNTGQIFREHPAEELPARWRWQATTGWGLALGLLAAVLAFQPLAGASPDQAFVYFQF